MTNSISKSKWRVHGAKLLLLQSVKYQKQKQKLLCNLSIQIKFKVQTCQYPYITQ